MIVVLRSLRNLVTPFENSWSFIIDVLYFSKFSPRALLTIQIGVSKDQLLVFDGVVHLRDFSPFLSFGAKLSFEELIFVHLELL